MNILQVAYKNLQRRKLRTAFTIAGITLSAWVLVTLLAFNKGYESSLNEDIDGMGFQIVLTAKGCPYEAATLMLTGGTGLKYMEESVVSHVNEEPEVTATTPMLMHAVFDPNAGENGGTAVYMGIDPVTYPDMKSYLVFNAGGWFKADALKEAVLGFEAAELEQREVGDIILINDEEYTVSGVLKRSGTQDDGMVFLPLKAVQQTFEKEGKITMLGIKIDKEADAAAFEEKLYELPDVQVVSMAQVKNTILSLVASAKAIVFAIVFIAFVIAMFGVLNTVLMSVFERYQEIGILKSMGAMPLDIFKMILTETAILCAIAGLLGIFFAFLFASGAETAVRHFLPFTPSGGLIQIDFRLSSLSFAAIVLMGIVGGIYPALRAAHIRPLSAIRSEN